MEELKLEILVGVLAAGTAASLLWNRALQYAYVRRLYRAVEQGIPILGNDNQLWIPLNGNPKFNRDYVNVIVG